jgi:hypothetical protein
VRRLRRDVLRVGQEGAEVMSRLILQSDDRFIEVELTTDDEDSQIIATCVKHDDAPECSWTERYDDMNDATQYADCHIQGIL